jgi:hypothetical protein
MHNLFSLPPSLSLSQNPEKQEKSTNTIHKQNTVLPFGLFKTIQTSFDNTEQYFLLYLN